MGYDYQLPAVQNPDMYGAFLRGQLGSQQLQANQQGLQQGQQQLQTGALNMDQLRLAMQVQRSRLARANQAFPVDQPQQGTQAAGAQDAGGQPTGGIQQGPQGMPPQGQQPQQSGNYLDDWIKTTRDIQNNSRMAQYDAIVKGGDPNVARKNEYEAQDAAMKDQANRAKVALTPYVTTIDETLSSPNPGAIVNNNPNLRQLYAQNAPKYGIDPRDPLQMTPQNLRTVLTGVHNDIAAKSFGAIAPKDMPFQMQDVPIGGGGIAQRNPITNKLEAGVPRESIGMLAGNAPIQSADTPEVQNWVKNILSGNGSLQNVPPVLRTSVSNALAGAGKDQFSPTAQSKMTQAAHRITAQYTDMAGYKLARDGAPYIARINAAMDHPGSVSDADLLDSMVKLNTGGNAVTENQVAMITNGRSFSDSVNAFKNKLQNGGVLSQNQRDQINGIAKSMFDNYLKQYQPIYEKASEQLQSAGIPKAFWTIPDLNAINSGGAASASAPASGGWGKASVVK